jgi:hypothetical protein
MTLASYLQNQFNLLEEGWRPQFVAGWQPGVANTADADLPALRLAPPGTAVPWFLELLAAPPPGQTQRRLWRRFRTPRGDFGLPSFRYLPVAIHDADATPFGLSAARPACMALAHMLEHAEPDRTPISNLAGQPPRFIKDLGRAVSLWWLAGQQDTGAEQEWLARWQSAAAADSVGDGSRFGALATQGLAQLAHYLRESHDLARLGLLAPHMVSLDAWRRAYAELSDLLTHWRAMGQR